MASWDFAAASSTAGRFLISATGYGPDGINVDLTTVRNIPTLISQYSSADPFGDAVAVLTFAGVTLMDDLTSIELRRWLRHYTDIDIYWAPAIAADESTAPEDLVIDPLTNKATLQTPYDTAIKVWEGFITSMGFSEDGLEIQCQGALFQVDRYRTKPFFPASPWPIESLIAEQFDHTRRPQLRTKPLQIVWPTGWARFAPELNASSPRPLAPVVTPGDNWTGYTTRDTGSWDHSLTEFVQNQLTSLITRDGDGVVIGDQWTIIQLPDRTPVMQVRSREATPDFTFWVGTPGATVQLASDSTQAENVIYGSGTDIHGVSWANSTISDDGTRTIYTPLAADPSVYPPSNNPLLVPGAFVNEAYTQFGSGFAAGDAMLVAGQYLGRDRDPGWTGTITLQTDPSLTLTKWQIRAGMSMTLMGFLGTGSSGIALHISAVTINPEAGTVELTVDSRYRDLLTVQEAIDRTRDPLSPVAMLQVNQASNKIADVQAPWDYSAGSGYVPQASMAFHNTRPLGAPFPYVDWAASHPPVAYPDWYVKCNAAAAADIDKWAGPISIRTAERGDIARTEFAAYDGAGNILKIPFHVSIYYLDVRPSDMPFAADGTGPSPFVDNAFESTDPATGQPWPEGNYLAPPQSLIIGWGNKQNGSYNRAGFSPGSEADGGNPTGLLVDQVTWSFDNTQNIEYQPYIPNQMQDDLALTLYAMFYAEYSEPVYFMGRLFYKNPGAS